ncbi:hypothetical protein ACRRTK_009936 [Alexandromys fortis]
MFSRLRRRVFGRQNEEGPENRERQKKATVHFWKKPSESWAGNWGRPKAVHLSPYKNHKPNALYEKVKMDHNQIMMELNNFENENTETLDNFKLLSKEIVFYRSETQQTHVEQVTVQDESHLQKDLQQEIRAESHPQQY